MPYMEEYSFQWDENKQKVNIGKHQIDFSDVVNIISSMIMKQLS